MKTFTDLKLSDKVYYVNTDGEIKEAPYISSIQNEYISLNNSYDRIYEAVSGAGYYADKSRALNEGHKIKLKIISRLNNEIKSRITERDKLINETR